MAGDAKANGNYYTDDTNRDIGWCLQMVIDFYKAEREEFMSSDAARNSLYEQGERFADYAVKAAKSLLRDAESEPHHAGLLDEKDRVMCKLYEHMAETMSKWPRRSALEEKELAEAIGCTGKSFATYCMALGQVTDVELLEQLPAFRAAWESLTISLTETAVCDVAGQAMRHIQLLDLLLKEEPPRSVHRYLRLVSRCFLSGFEAECVICCRSAIDEALQEALTEEGCSIPARIMAARKHGLLSDEGQKKALEVVSRGNKAVHGDPYATRDVFETLQYTLAVIRELTAPPLV